MKHIHRPSPAAPKSLTHLPSALKRSAMVLAAVLAASFMTSCDGPRAVHVPSPQPVFFTELEPNDSPDFPDFVGILDDQSFLVVEGHVQAVGFDIVDHIEFESDRPIEVDFTLEAFGAFGDVDVSIYDPIANEIIGTFATDGRFEVGTVIVHDPGRPFQFIIEAFDSDSPWSLELIAFPGGCNCAASTASDDSDDDSLPKFTIRREHEILRLDGAADSN